MVKLSLSMNGAELVLVSTYWRRASAIFMAEAYTLEATQGFRVTSGLCLVEILEEQRPAHLIGSERFKKNS